MQPILKKLAYRAGEMGFLVLGVATEALLQAPTSK